MKSILRGDRQQRKLQGFCRGKWNNILTNNRKIVWGMLLSSLLGFCVFYIIPFIISFFYSMMDNPISRKYCGFENYISLFENPYFIRGLKNTTLFMALGIPCNMLFSFAVAWIVRKSSRYAGLLGLIFLIPMVIPSATSAFFWGNFWAEQGTFNKFLTLFHVTGLDWLDCDYSMVIMILIFVWKNIGYNMALYLSGLTNIPNQYYEYADVEGAGSFQKFRHITLPYLTPTLFLILIMSFVNSFKIFKEIYLLTGDYPPNQLYVLQHYMNNMFLSLDYSRLSSAVYILTAVIVVVVVCIFGIEEKMAENLHD